MFCFRGGQEIGKEVSARTLVIQKKDTCKPEGQWNETADVMLNNIKESAHPVFRGISALNRGVLKRKGGRCTPRSSSELVWDVAQLISGQIHVNREKSVAKKNDQLSQRLKPQEVDFLVQTQRRNDEAAGNRLRICLQNLKN